MVPRFWELEGRNAVAKVPPRRRSWGAQVLREVRSGRGRPRGPHDAVQDVLHGLPDEPPQEGAPRHPVEPAARRGHPEVRGPVPRHHPDPPEQERGHMAEGCGGWQAVLTIPPRRPTRSTSVRGGRSTRKRLESSGARRDTPSTSFPIQNATTTRAVRYNSWRFLHLSCRIFLRLVFGGEASRDFRPSRLNQCFICHRPVPRKVWGNMRAHPSCWVRASAYAFYEMVRGPA